MSAHHSREGLTRDRAVAREIIVRAILRNAKGLCDGLIERYDDSRLRQFRPDLAGREGRGVDRQRS